MALLNKKKRQEYLKTAGYYKGNIDGILGTQSRAAILAMKRDFYPKKWWNTKYTIGFNRLLVNDNMIRKNAKNFSLKGDRLLLCECGGRYCGGAPVLFNEQLLKNLQKVRDRFGPVTITSGLRCKKYNNSLVGSISTSRHTKGKAVDLYIAGVTDTKAGRQKVIKFWYTLPKANYAYSDTPNMGNAVHVDVK